MTVERDLRRLESRSELISTSVVDAVPVLHAYAEGQITACLVFRVGWADESLMTSGITHLVEHLALYGQDLPGGHHNGETRDRYTFFHATGTEAEVVTFVNEVCAALRDLPLHRLETEKRILRTEASRRSVGPGELHRFQRHGARGHGLALFNEIGLDSINPDQVRTWAATWFNSSNVVLWLTSDVLPEGLDLSLPSGERRPLPAVVEGSVGSTPAYFTAATGHTLIDALVPRSTAAVAFAHVAGKALFRELRHEGGYSYQATCEYEPVTAEEVRITLSADALPDQQAAVIGGMIDVLAGLRAGGIRDSDLDGFRTGGQFPSQAAAWLNPTAMALLSEEDMRSPRDIERERSEVTHAEIAAVADLVWRRALAQIPEGGLEWAGFSPMPAWSEDTVAGRPYVRLGDASTRLIIGEEGVSFTSAEGVVSVRFADLAGYGVWPDGGRQLIGLDGFRITIEPQLYLGMNSAVVAKLDERVPSMLRMALPERDAEVVPQPPGSGPTSEKMPAKKAKRMRWRGFGTWATVLGVALMALTLILAVLTFIDWERLGLPGNEDTLQDVLLEAYIVGGLAALVIILAVGVSRRRAWNRLHNNHPFRR